MKFIKLFTRSRPFSKVTITLSLLLILFTIIMEFYFPDYAVNGFQSYILAFEFAETTNDIQLLLQNLTDVEIRNIDLGNYFDFGYMLTYSLLLAYIFAKSAKEFGKKWLNIGIPISIIILLSDFLENLILLKITKIYSVELDEILISELLQNLQIITWVKWGGIAFVLFIFYEVLYRLKWFYKIGGIICLFPFIYILAAGVFTPNKISIFTFLIFIAFFVLILFGITYKKDIKKAANNLTA